MFSISISLFLTIVYFLSQLDKPGSKTKVFIGYGLFLLLSANISWFFWLIDGNSIQYGVYKYLKRSFPIWLFAFWFSFRNHPKLAKVFEWSSKTFILAVMIFLGFLSWNFLNHVPFKDIFIINWSYHGVLTWNIVAPCIFFGYLKQKVRPFTSLTLTTLSMFVSALIYELFIILPLITEGTWLLFSAHFPLLIQSQWVSIVLLCYVLHRLRWKPNKKFWILLTFAFGFSIFYTFNMHLYGIARIPTAIAFIYLPFANTNKNRRPKLGGEENLRYEED